MDETISGLRARHHPLLSRSLSLISKTRESSELSRGRERPLSDFSTVVVGRTSLIKRITLGRELAATTIVQNSSTKSEGRKDDFAIVRPVR